MVYQQSSDYFLRDIIGSNTSEDVLCFGFIL